MGDAGECGKGAGEGKGEGDKMVTQYNRMQEEIKMARSASLKERTLPSTQSLPLSHSLSISLKKSAPALETPEDTSSAALRQLKKINDYKEMLKGRLSALQILEEKNENRAVRNKNRYQFHRQVHQEILTSKQRKARLREQKEQEVLEMQEKARNERAQRIANLKLAQKQLSKHRLQDYKQVKEKRGEIERTISAVKRQEVEINRARSLNIRQYEQSQKNNVEEYLSSKRKEVREEDRSSAAELRRAKEAKRVEIEQLSKLQQLMMQKQGKSRMTREESETRLSKIVGGSLTSSRITKLPSIRPQRSQQDLISL